ncbi:MAG: response regulator [Actinobacteria bacterium]|nr:response regulator [Actinomycetota bacterium]
MAEDQKTVLVADDDRDLVTALSIRLRAAGYKVVGAYDGEETYNQAIKHNPDLIILDVRMPSGGGFFAIDQIKHSLNLRDIPVIFLTAFDDEDMKEQAKELGAEGYFRKPFNDEEFMGIIRRVLGE